MQNPLRPCNICHTPESEEALNEYISRYSGSEAVIAWTIAGMTMNLCHKLVEQAIYDDDLEAKAEGTFRDYHEEEA